MRMRKSCSHRNCQIWFLQTKFFWEFFFDNLDLYCSTFWSIQSFVNILGFCQVLNATSPSIPFKMSEVVYLHLQMIFVILIRSSFQPDIRSKHGHLGANIFLRWIQKDFFKGTKISQSKLFFTRAWTKY